MGIFHGKFSPVIHLKYRLHTAYTNVHKEFRFYSFAYHLESGNTPSLPFTDSYEKYIPDGFQHKKATTEVMTLYLLMYECGNPAKQIVLAEQHCSDQRYG